jgi:hypothetical protein
MLTDFFLLATELQEGDAFLQRDRNALEVQRLTHKLRIPTEPVPQSTPLLMDSNNSTEHFVDTDRV